MDIELRNITKSFGTKQVIQNFSAVFEEKKVSAIMAPSGSGKTTLLNIIAGLETPDDGKVIGIENNFSYVFQEDRLCEDFTVFRNVRMCAADSITDKDINSLLSILGLGESLKSKTALLSGGMKRRVAIARAIASKKEIILLDEPFKGLDEESMLIAARVLLSLEKTIILVTHSEKEAKIMNAVIYRL